MEKPLTYDWLRDGKVYNVCVDLNMHIHEAKLQLLWSVTLSVQHAEKLSFFQSRAYQKMLSKLDRLCGNGKRVAQETTADNSFSRYVWYVEEEECAAAMKEFCDSQSKSELQCDVRYDPKWQYYYDSFYPGPAQWQTIQNAKLLQLRRREGDDPAQPRPVKHEVYFFDDSARLFFIEAAKQSGFAIEETYFASENTKPCAVTLRHICKMEKQALDKATTCLVNLAEKYTGDYGGWDAAVYRGSMRR